MHILLGLQGGGGSLAVFGPPGGISQFYRYHDTKPWRENNLNLNLGQILRVVFTTGGSILG